MMMRPIPTASAIADPDMPAKIMLATTFTCPRPPRKRPTSTRQNCRSRSVRLPMFMRYLEEARIDVLLATSKHNIRYLLGGHHHHFFDYADAIGVSRYLPILVYP